MENFDRYCTLFLPNLPTDEEWRNIAKATNGGIVITGTALWGQMGTTIGQIDFGESQDSYLFRVSLPGIQNDNNHLICELKCDGRVAISGFTIGGEETVIRNGIVFYMQTQNFCPTGNFSIEFKLPGRIDTSQGSANYSPDGILEVIVTKDSVNQRIYG